MTEAFEDAILNGGGDEAEDRVGRNHLQRL
jgi:hypothetical protein